MSVLVSVLLWTVSWIHFVIGTTLVLLLGAIFGPKRIDRILRFHCRNVVRLAGARLSVRRAPGFDPSRTCLFVSNHVNIFDPFVLYSALPQFFRGIELESHFRVPVYGWLMKRFGNVPVPDARTPTGLKRTYRITKEALDAGTSLVIFPEGSRTMDGKVGPFEMGGFRMARQLGYAIVPVTIQGAFEWHRKGSRMLRPGPVTVHIHDTIDLSGVPKGGLEELRDRVRAIVAGPLR
jgi:1-acyl-sn-glycerol-3-phosphate acyltransferase